MRGDVRVIHEESEVKEKLLEGARIVAEAVGTTYGPTSNTVRIEKSYGGSVVTKDGVTVSTQIVLEDPVMDMGAESLISAAKRSNVVSGDGTSATTILGYHIMRKAYERISAGANAMQLRKGIDKAAIDIKAELDKLSQPISKKEDLEFVANISASDEAIGQLVADTVERTGGVGISVEQYDGLGVIQDIVEGTYFDRGYTTQHFVTDRGTAEAVHENCNILILEQRIKQNQDIVPIIEMIGQEAEFKTLMIVGNISGQALETCVLTNLKGGLKIVVVPPPVYGDMVVPFLEDLGTLVGARLVPTNMPPDQVNMDYVGFAEKVTVTHDSTTILGGQGIEEDINTRIAGIKQQLKDPKYSAFQRERLELRLSKMEGKIGRIRVGGATETEAEEIKYRVDDAINAARAAKEGGIVAGGATTLARLASSKVPQMPTDEQVGYAVVLEALQEPFKVLMENAGEDGGYRLQQVLRAKENHGFDVKNITEEPVDLIKAGVIDPVLVLKSVVENSCSAAGVAITSKVAITLNQEWKLKHKGQ